MFDAFKPGQTIHLTIERVPRRENSVLTIERLMRLDPDTARSLRHAHGKRQQRLNVFNRGNRDWTSRETCGRIVRCQTGQSWKLVYNLNLKSDLDSVAPYLAVKGA